MKDRLKLPLIAVVVLALAGGGFAWYWRATRPSRLARSANPDDRREAIHLLSGRTGRGARRILHPLVRDEDLGVAAAAVRAVGAEGSEESFALLEQVARGDERRAIGHLALAALGRCPTVQTARFAQALRSDDPAMRSAGVQALANRKGPEVVSLLLEAMDDPARVVRMRAAEALSRLTGRPLKDYDPRDGVPPAQRRQAIERIRARLAG